MCLLTRYCLSTRHNYHVRTVDPVSGARGAELHDEQVERLIALCIGVDLEDARVDGPVKWALRQAGLPSSEGGFGAVAARTVRHAAYYGSCVLALPVVRDLFRDVGLDRQPDAPVIFGQQDAEDSLYSRFGGFLPKSFLTCYTTYGTYFDALKVALDAVGEDDPPAELLADIPPPIAHCVLSRRVVNATAETHGIASRAPRPSNAAAPPVLPPLDFTLPQYKAQHIAGEVMKTAELRSLRSEVAAAGAHEVIARLDDVSSFGGGAFLNVIPLGRDNTGRFKMRCDHFRTAARAHVGLPPLGVQPSDVCCVCGRRWDHGTRGRALCRAAVHTSICSTGQFRRQRHDAVADVLVEMYKAIGGTAAADHKRFMNTTGTNTLNSTCTLSSGKRVDVVLFGAGAHGRDVAVDVSFVCAEAYAGGFASCVAKREGQKNKLYVEECKAIGIDFFPFVLGAHGGFGSEAKRLWSLLVAQAKKRVDSDWRHSWTASSYSTTWKQKLSVALATQIAIGAQCRAPLLTRQRAMGEGVDVEGGEVQGRVYEGVAEGRAPSGMSV